MKIYHLCPSGKVWIFEQREVQTRKKGEALFQILSDPGDVLKIDIPGQDTIKITKIINTNNTMGNKKSQFKTLGKEIAKTDEELRKEKEAGAREFYKEYTALSERTGYFIDCVIEYNEYGMRAKTTVAWRKDKEDKPAKEVKPVTKEKKDEEPKAEEVAA